MRKSNEKNVFKKNSGITLIALVITIIVLLILAGVTIVTLTGDNGVLTKASEAKEKTEEAKEEELRKLTQAEAATHTENSTHTDKSTGKEETVTIPAGFAVSQVEGENTIAGGLVIIDKNGNEFVWVPVGDISQFILKKGYPIESLDIDLSQEPLVNGGYENEEKEFLEMLSSVKKNNGFYIGRYEAGKDEEGNVVCKKNFPVYNNVMWGESMNDDTSGAINLAKNFGEVYNYTDTISTLCYGVQWDATMQFMDENYISGTCDPTSYVRDSSGKGNFSR